ncbi:MAG: rod shape-determining protein MreC [Candidatus Omnitrophica bacterium]|nr:rod shape-determining protein MreC [Candidatus Omnitrophota bacterium]
MRFKRTYVLFLFGILSFIFLIQRPGFGESIHGWTLTVLKPALVTGTAFANGVSHLKVEMARFWQTFHARGEMEDKLARLESEVIRLREVEKENERLQGLLDLKETQSPKAVAARIIGRDPLPWQKTVILDKGHHGGIQKGMAIVLHQDLIGRIVEVGPSTSRGILLTDVDSRASAITSEKRAQGIVAGDGTPMLEMKYLELDSEVSVGETVLTSGVGGLFPKGIRIGKIVALERDPDGLHLLAEIEPAIKFSKLEEVLCLDYFQEELSST